jgi:hypothetical protein
MYKLHKTTDGKDVIIKTDGNITTSFLVDSDNTDYQEYLKWIAAGNTPEPADE